MENHFKVCDTPPVGEMFIIGKVIQSKVFPAATFVPSTGRLFQNRRAVLKLTLNPDFVQKVPFKQVIKGLFFNTNIYRKILFQY